MSEMLLDRPVDADRRRPCPASALGDHREIRVSATPPIHPKLRRSSPSCERPATTRTEDAYVA
jgi:hypothetical protein